MQLAYGHPDDAVRHRSDHAHLLGERDEIGWRHRPTGWVCPARQRLIADCRAIRQPHLGLKVQLELVLVDRLAQLRRESEPLRLLPIARALVHLESAVLPESLPRHERGMPYQGFAVVAVLGEEAHAYGCAHIEPQLP